MTRTHRIRRFLAAHMDLCLVFLIGVFVRVQYMVLTPHNVRAYDWSGHKEYILYMVNTFALPPADFGWETHQPPLYYALATMWARVSVALHRQVLLWEDLQFFSLLIGICTLAAMIWIALQAFPRKKQEENERLLFLGLMATLPGVVFLSSRITNDGFMLLGVTVFAGFLLRWWKSGTMRDWIACCLITSLCFQIKINGGMFCLATLSLCCVLRHGVTLRSVVRDLSALAIIIGAMLAILVNMRSGNSHYVHIVSGIAGGLNIKLMLPYHTRDFLIFNPLEVLRLPFNDAWTDAFRRHIFWEYLYKSIFIGEWRYPNLIWLVRLMMLTGFGILALAVAGCIRSIRKKVVFAVPMIAMFISSLLILYTFRIFHNAACNQDFRFIANVAIPFGLFVCAGTRTLPAQWQKYAIAYIIIFCCICTAFLLMVTA